MTFTRRTRTEKLLATLGLAMGCHASAMAQDVFKCTVAGKTVYQAAPCEGKGRALEIKPGPTEEEVQAARARAEAQRAAVTALPAPAPQATPFVRRPVDCAKLNKDRGDAFGHRNATVRESRDSNRDRSAAVNRAHEDIRRIEREMVRGGCQPT